MWHIRYMHWLSTPNMFLNANEFRPFVLPMGLLMTYLRAVKKSWLLTMVSFCASLIQCDRIQALFVLAKPSISFFFSWAFVSDLNRSNITFQFLASPLDSIPYLEFVKEANFIQIRRTAVSLVKYVVLSSLLLVYEFSKIGWDVCLVFDPIFKECSCLLQTSGVSVAAGQTEDSLPVAPLRVGALIPPAQFRIEVPYQTQNVLERKWVYYTESLGCHRIIFKMGHIWAGQKVQRHFAEFDGE